MSACYTRATLTAVSTDIETAARKRRPRSNIRCSLFCVTAILASFFWTSTGLAQLKATQLQPSKHASGTKQKMKPAVWVVPEKWRIPAQAVHPSTRLSTVGYFLKLSSTQRRPLTLPAKKKTAPSIPKTKLSTKKTYTFVVGPIGKGARGKPVIIVLNPRTWSDLGLKEFRDRMDKAIAWYNAHAGMADRSEVAGVSGSRDAPPVEPIEGGDPNPEDDWTGGVLCHSENELDVECIGVPADYAVDPSPEGLIRGLTADCQQSPLGCPTLALLPVGDPGWDDAEGPLRDCSDQNLLPCIEDLIAQRIGGGDPVEAVDIPDEVVEAVQYWYNEVLDDEDRLTEEEKELIKSGLEKLVNLSDEEKAALKKLHNLRRECTEYCTFNAGSQICTHGPLIRCNQHVESQCMWVCSPVAGF